MLGRAALSDVMPDSRTVMRYFVRRAGVALFLSFALWSCEAESMGKLYLFSEVRGVVTHNGKPVVGVVVEQNYRRDDKNISRSVQTSEDGEFHFTEVVTRSFWASILPHQPRIEQQIYIKIDGKELPAWRYVKGNYRQNGELDGKPINIYCDIAAPVRRIPIRGDWDYVSGICELR
jgi:hypothetical protein